MQAVVVVAAEDAAAAAIRQMMSIRDNETKQRFSIVYGESSQAPLQAKLATALASPTVKTPQAYTVDFGAFLSSRNAPFAYAAPPLAIQVNSLPKTPADDLMFSGHPIHSGGVWWDSTQLVDISYNQKLESLGISHTAWTADVVAPLRVITQEARNSRTLLGNLLRATSAASWTMRITQGSNHCMVWTSNHIGLGAEEKDRTTCYDYMLCACLIPFRVLSCVVTTPFFLLMTISSSFLGSLLDLMCCYSCRVDTAAKLAAVTNVLQAYKHLDEKSLIDKTHRELQELAHTLSAKFGLIFEAVVTGELVEGQYFQKYIPAHALVKHSLAIFAPGDSSRGTHPL